MRSLRYLLAPVLALVLVLTPALAHEGEALKRRLVVGDAKAPLVQVLDLEKGEVVARFTVPSPASLEPLPDGQHALAVHEAAGMVSFLFSGLRLLDHGDHADLKEETPYVLATLRTGPKPTHTAVKEPWLAVFHDGDGSVALFDLRRLGLDLGFRQIATGGPEHGAVALLGEALLVGGLESGRVEIYTLGGPRALALPEPCPGLHGEAVLGRFAAFGCQGAVLLVEARGNGFLARKLPTPEGERVSQLAAHNALPYMVGNLGAKGLVLVFPQEGRLEALPLPASVLRMGFDREGEALYALAADGALYRVDAKERRLTGTLPLLAPYRQEDPRPALALGHGVAYVADPAGGRVLEVDLKAWALKRTFPVGGAPGALALLELSGVEH
ncbi:hypothetical protein [Thermus filiformis]|uniref:Lipoprotein n=1 Tax=Thermus filiformis TaxID=276 RepID=A0A0A2WM33_THEFI|nr:hypothetical protein [Thermus filiformis]KGQ21216.2 hypothetical protein THFILI_01960 [Thermus filiformis]